MNAGKIIYSKLTADAAVQGYLGGKIYPQVAPQDAEPLFLVYSTTSSQDTETKEQSNPLTTLKVQVDIYGEQMIDCYDAATEVRRVLNGINEEVAGECVWSTCFKGIQDGYSGVDEVYRVMLFFDFIINN